MARVSGPLMSVDASGQFGGAMVFGKWKGRNYVRQLVTPANPKSAKQTGVRSMMKFLAQIWYGLSAPVKATWDEMAATKSISAFNAFVGENLARWQNFLAPTQEFPAAESANAITISTQTLTGGQGFVTLDITPSGAGDNWGYAIFRDTAEITSPNWVNCVAVIEANGASAVSYSDSPLAAGTYHYRVGVFNTDGTLGTIHADGTATVT
jgi:hypothetical protein